MAAAVVTSVGKDMKKLKKDEKAAPPGNDNEMGMQPENDAAPLTIRKKFDERAARLVPYNST
jgi:hypothetical protein